MNIRKAKIEDLPNIAEVHIRCFPKSFSTQLGKSLLNRFYEEYMKGNPELFLVADNNEGELVGFCMGYLCKQNTFMRDFLHNNALRVICRCMVLAVTGNKFLYEKIGKVIKKHEEFNIIEPEYMRYSADETGDLLSICVLSEERGSGVAQQLIKQYEDALRQCNMKLCLLSVSPHNDRAIRFYEKNGFSKYRSVSNTITYAKKIG